MLNLMVSLPVPLHTLHRMRQLNHTPHPQAHSEAGWQSHPHVRDYMWSSGDQGAELTWTSFMPSSLIIYCRTLSHSFPGVTSTPATKRTSKLKTFETLSHLEKHLMAQWLRICLPMQGTRVRALVREDPSCGRAAGPVHHNYWVCALEPASHNCWAPALQLLRPAHLEPVLHNKRGQRNEKPTHRIKEWPSLAATGESPRTATKTQRSQN